MRILILLSIFLVSTCGIIYELIAGTVASYLLGDTVSQFSLVIGVYLFSMGIGSFFSKYIQRNYVFWFIQVEILIGIVGGCTPLVLFVFFEYAYYFSPLFYFLLFATGFLVGLEIPLLMRLLKETSDFNVLVADVFTFDYIGALAASIIFPSILIPYLGILKVSALFGLVNLLVALLLIKYYSNDFPFLRKMYIQTGFAILLVGSIFAFSHSINQVIENVHYDEPVIISKSSKYQKIVITKNENDIRLYLNHNLQFSSRDEYRYHESLVHPLFMYQSTPMNVLILGGGDGMALREVLKYESVNKVTLVDLDPFITDLFSNNELLTRLNGNSFADKRVNIINDDAFQFLRKSNGISYDLVIIDFPDPSNYAIGKLYSMSFFEELKRVLNLNSVVCIQSTSPFYAPQSFWCINNTILASGFKTLPYHTHVPSFGEWGFILFSQKELMKVKKLRKDLLFLNENIFTGLCEFPKDMSFRTTHLNKLNNQALVNYFDDEWSKVK